MELAYEQNKRMARRLVPHFSQSVEARMETFTHVTLGRIVSSDGYAVRFVRRDLIVYEDGDRVLEIEADFGVPKDGKYGIAVALFSAFLRGWTRPKSAPITGERERIEIEGRVRRALEFNGGSVEFV